MSGIIIQVENLSKYYRLGSIGTGTLSHDLNRWWSKKTGKPDPLTEIKTFNSGAQYKEDFIWSLKDINFEINAGEIFGIIGKNGAGKSTLLKLLSKISKPTTGKIHINGRIASLLEVGTGFHPDLTGRENVYLNGAILGMKKAEIKRKFDEIVDFSGVERFIDTPVKRYSSGMYVRLAFAVAAHLDPEILIIDEVLAVGDTEFQQRCLGKIKDISFQQGRTVLFVSHSLPAIKQLCNKVLLLENGLQKAIGTVENVLRIYEDKIKDKDSGLRADIPVNNSGYFTEWLLESSSLEENMHTCYSRENCSFVFMFQANEFIQNCEMRFMLTSEREHIIYASSLSNSGSIFSLQPGKYKMILSMQLPIKQGKYHIEVSFISMGKVIDSWHSSTRLTILDNYESQLDGFMLNLPTDFKLEEIDFKLLSTEYLTS